MQINHLSNQRMEEGIFLCVVSLSQPNKETIVRGLFNWLALIKICTNISEYTNLIWWV